MTMEGAFGAEQYKFRGEYARRAAWHNAVLPFTRNVVGPLDYTPITFSDHKFPHRTTNGHELALAVVFESGIFDRYASCSLYAHGEAAGRYR